MFTDIATLTESAAQLSATDFEHFLTDVYSKRAKKRVPSVSMEAQQLLEKIYQKQSPLFLARFETLREKCAAEAFSEEEHAEYLGIIEQMENRSAERLEQIVQLAKLRGVSPQNLIEQLGILPFYAH